MTTIVLTYRDRDIKIVKHSLDTLQQQSDKVFKVILVNYGSSASYTKSIQELSANYTFVNLVHCQTEGELWCKSRAINIALRLVKTSYVCIGDVDMLYHPNFIAKLKILKQSQTATYFQVGFLSQTESQQVKAFNDYDINFKSNEEATGMTFLSTEDLKSINGFDEFYHGWGSEDTDVHVRLKASGMAVNFYDKEVLMLHQWHPKAYRSKTSTAPFHSSLEQINHAYLAFTKVSKQVKANLKFGYGNYSQLEYDALTTIEQTYVLTNKQADIKGFVANVLLQHQDVTIHVSIKKDSAYQSLKQTTKFVLGKKTISFLSFQAINDLLLETIINNLRQKAYHYSFDADKEVINLTIKL